uniref:Innexin n=1 Tax=Acrobeloides nanus TaxID=290746 RepID=A0A914C477_9BILA
MPEKDQSSEKKPVSSNFLAGDLFKFIRHEDDGGDPINELNYRFTPFLIFIVGVSLMGMLYVKRPIQCWLPPEFPNQWEEYAETYCFVKSTYFVEGCRNEDQHEDACLETASQDGQTTTISYYQWVPVVLLLQALAFMAPNILWRSWDGNSGIDVKSVLNSAAMVRKKFDKETRNAQVNKAATHLVEALEMQKELKTSSFFLTSFGKRKGVYLTGLYLFTKLLYVLNVVAQFVILNAFLGPQYTFWGLGILKDLIAGRAWEESGHFPRVTLCDFNVRVLGNIHRWTVQCVLMINMFNEKIYIFFWFAFVGFLSILSFFYWFLATVFKNFQRGFIEKYLRVTGVISDYSTVRDQRLLSDFISKFLRPDGVFLLRLIQTNGGDLLVGEIINALFSRYRTKLEERAPSEVVIESPDSTNL